ncbi:MAG: DNA alkylation repair protein [Bacteroidales bacterium]|nr:DNA alkylation repair protein [Bacteroidales bacterium]MBN2758371.1 DNA alkylation repair protein [Bacteroidales bacterium]
MDEVALKYKELKKRFRTRENGPAVESMIRFGLIYQKNHGVALSELAEMAKDYKNDSVFAEFLWKQNIREAKILSLMIDNPENITEQRIKTILENINNIELAEQACYNLFEKVEGILSEIKNWLSNPNKYYKITGLILISRILKTKNNINNEEILKFFDIFDEIAKEDNMLIVRSLSKALLQIGKKDENFEKLVLDFITKINEKGYKSAAWLKEEVVYFLINK